MNEEKTNIVLQTICTYGTTGEYLILARKELLEKMSGTLSEQEMDSAILELQAIECVEIRYTDGDVYCLTVLPKGILRCEKIKEAEIQKREKEARKQEERERREREKRKSQYRSETLAVIPDEDKEEEKTIQVENMVTIPWNKIIGVCVAVGFVAALIGGFVGAFLTKLL